jgi:hypothetical protein
MEREHSFDRRAHAGTSALDGAVRRRATRPSELVAAAAPASPRNAAEPAEIGRLETSQEIATVAALLPA